MSDTHTPGMGDNRPPLADQLAISYSPIQLAQDHETLGLEVQDLGSRLRAFTAVDSPEENEAAGALVIEARSLAAKIDQTCETVKEPVYRAYKTTLDFFAGLNNSDTRKPGPITAGKVRLERLVRDYGFRVAEEQRRIRELAAQAERERAAREAEAARLAEEANKPAMATVLIDQAVKSERVAEKHEEVAQGPVQDLARSKTTTSTTGLRAVKGFDVTDREALRANLGVLGQSFTADAVMAAVRKYRIDCEAFAPWPFRDDDQHAQRRVVVPGVPVPGVEFFVAYEGMVRN